MADACVKVGVRIRPLTAKEQSQSSVIPNYDSETLMLRNQTFTYDYVFGPELDQLGLYESTAAPMLKSFLEGYNVTIIAYGQTGSGKTFTMGTSGTVGKHESGNHYEEGLLPRFVTDLFENIQDTSGGSGRVDSNITVSFLEIYGEDVFDLVCDSNNQCIQRPSLAVRENDQGFVFVQGLNELEVHSAQDALTVLQQGSHNRSTGATAMNAGSSRSHAVYTITLNQRISSTDCEDDTNIMTSKLTFVDLAGSERLKRTGAEGQRMKEGIQINSGLFNLGQVINGLADDQRLKAGGKAIHIPYRNSKLTHLLKDALGGNSKTLFLACVSPAEQNESETYSTLTYARQARNIQNKPVQNMDKTQMQIRRLKCTAKTWMIKALTLMFAESSNHFNNNSEKTAFLTNSPLPKNSGLGHLSPVGRKSTGQFINLSNSLNESTKMSSDCNVTELLQRTDVQAYIKAVDEAISASLSEGATQSSRKIRFSMLSSSPAPGFKPVASIRTDSAYAVGQPIISKKLFAETDESSRMDIIKHSNSDIINNPFEPKTKSGFSEDVDAEKLISRMVEFVNKDKEMYSVTDDESGKIASMDQEIQEKEDILNKLMDAVKGFSTLKTEYEKLVDAITVLDTERRDLEISLERALANKKNENSKNIEKLQERFKKVNEELLSMRCDRSKKENAYQLMQRESARCEQLAKDLQGLKEIKVQLQRKQKEQTQLHLKYKKDQQIKMQQLKKSDIKKQQQMNDLKNELQKKQRILGHKDREISRIQSKLKACEEHISQLLRIQSRNNNKSTISKQASSATPLKSMQPLESEEYCKNFQKGYFTNSITSFEMDHYNSSKSVLEAVALEWLERKENAYDILNKNKTLSDLNKELIDMTSELKSLQSQKQKAENIERGNNLDLIIQELESDIDRIAKDIEHNKEELKEISKHASKADSNLGHEDLGRSIILGLSINQAQAMIWDMLQEKVETTSKLRNFEDQLKLAVENSVVQQEKLNLSEQQLIQLKRDLSTKLAEAEKRRVNDMWELVKAKEQSIDQNNNCIAGDIMMQHTKELENTLNECLMSEETLKRELQDYKEQVFNLNSLVLKSQLKSMGQESLEYNAENLCNLNNIVSLWDELGIPESERIEAFHMITTAKVNACNELSERVRQQYLSATKQRDFLRSEISAISKIVGIEKLDDTVNTNTNMFVVIEQLQKVHSELRDQLTENFDRAIEIKITLQSLLTQVEILVDDASLLSFSFNKVLLIPDYFDSDESLGLFLTCLQQIDIYLTPTNLTQWENGIKLLHSIRSRNVEKCESTIQEIKQISSSMGIISLDDFLNSIEVDKSDDLLKKIVLDAVTNGSESDQYSLGSTRVVDTMTKFSTILKTVEVNRRETIKLLIDFSHKWNDAIIFSSRSLIISLDHGSLNHDSSAILKLFNAIIDKFSSINDDVAEFKDVVKKLLMKWSSLLDCEFSCISKFDNILTVNAENIVNATVLNTKIDALDNETDKFQLKKIMQLFLSMSSIMSEIEEFSLFVEESWIQELMQEILSTWKRIESDVLKAIMWQKEFSRLQNLDNALSETKRIDAQLSKHIKEMEEFELMSKQNRSKLLSGIIYYIVCAFFIIDSGSSKGLIEEERFRKAGKRKYENLIEKLEHSYNATEALLLRSHIDLMSPIFGLTSAGLTALKAKGKSSERTELMHLHTTTHGTRRWSGDLIENETENLEPRQKKNETKIQSTANAVLKVTHPTEKNLSPERNNVFADCLTAVSQSK